MLKSLHQYLKLLVTILLVLVVPGFLNNAQGQIKKENIYVKSGAKTYITKEFVEELCKAARIDEKDDAGPTQLELLINMAAQTSSEDTSRTQKVKSWHRRYGKYCQCKAKDHFPKGDFIRQLIHSNNRAFANKIGPKNELPLNLQLKDPNDGLTIYEYVNKERIRLEAKHDNKRFEFQQDEEWRNIMFFYFLFAEYSVN